MDFVLDKISEDSFYENLFLGLPKLLEESINCSIPYLDRAPPVPHNLICAWEQKNGVLLPEDLRSFYGSTDGLLYSYKYYLQEQCEENSLLCKIEINKIENLIQLGGYVVNENPGVDMEGDRYSIRLGVESKVFELQNLGDEGKIVLVYINARYFPNIWIQTKSGFFFLSDDFTNYLRMCIYHMGIPFWQFAYTDLGIPESSQLLFRLMAPGILPLDGKIEEKRKLNENPSNDIKSDTFLNKIDVGIFRAHLRSPAPETVGNSVQVDNSPRKKRNYSKGKAIGFRKTKSDQRPQVK